jgi:hypothetical protein
VLRAVDLNDDSSLQAAEVCDERAYRMLSPEFRALQLTATEPLPQFGLGVGLFTTQAAGALAE